MRSYLVAGRVATQCRRLMIPISQYLRLYACHRSEGPELGVAQDKAVQMRKFWVRRIGGADLALLGSDGQERTLPSTVTAVS